MPAAATILSADSASDQSSSASDNSYNSTYSVEADTRQKLVIVSSRLPLAGAGSESAKTLACQVAITEPESAGSAEILQLQRQLCLANADVATAKGIQRVQRMQWAQSQAQLIDNIEWLQAALREAGMLHIHTSKVGYASLWL